MSQPPNRKRQHQQSTAPPVKLEQQEEEESQSISQGGNGRGDDIKEVKLKMAALQIKLENQELHARLHAKSEEGILANLKQENRALWIRLKEVEENAQTMMDAFGQRLAALEAKHQQDIAGLSAKLVSKNQKKYAKKYANRNQQQQPAIVNCQTPDSDCVVVDIDMEEESPAALIPPPPIPPNLVPSHSANLPDFVKVQESSTSQGNLNILDHRLHSLESQHRPKTTLAAAAVIAPPLNKMVVEAKRLCNPLENCWNSNHLKATMNITQPDQLNVHNTSTTNWGNVIARKGFFLSAVRQLQQNNFAGPILYYYEITAKSPFLFDEGRLYYGVSHGTIAKGSWIGQAPNTYAMQDHKRDYCLLSGDTRFFEWPDGAIKPTLYGCGDVFGCGLVMSADNKLAIFFTTNGILMGKQFPIVHYGSTLYPCLQLNLNVTVEANFGQKPFKYNIDECPGLQMQW